MNYKIISRGMISLILVVLVSSFSYEAPLKKFSPVGNWEYQTTGVPEEFQTGTLIITEKDKEYSVSVVLNEYLTVKGENVVYQKKSIKFTIFVESAEFTLSGNFNGDEFSGTLSYTEGDFEVSAVRKTD